MKVFFKAILSVFIVIAVIFVPFKFYDEVNTDKITDEIFRRREKYFYGVINIWQIDCFEGGTGSRTNWLKNICGGFERQNNGVYVNVESVSMHMAKKLLESGQKKPDMVSYGFGIGIKEEQLEALEIETVLNEVSDAVYKTAVPWCMGAYFVFGEESKWGEDGGVYKTKKGTKTVYSMGVPERDGYDSYNALLKSTDRSFGGEYAMLSASSSEIFEAYNYSYKVNSMVGTQRDFYRFYAAESRQASRGGNIKYSGYTDLFQYVSILKCNDEKKLRAMNGFVDYLLKKEQQDKLGSIGLFPVRFDADPEYSVSTVQNGWQEIKNNGIDCKSFLFDADGANVNKEEHLKKLQKTG